ncbi:MAG: hypothetical protein Kow00106_22280 [Anaerolineae bacterium]
MTDITDSPFLERNARAGSLSLRANFSWTLIGNVVYAACQWGMLVVLAKLGTPETVGQFALALAVTAPVILLTDLQLRVLQATDARREFLFGDYLGLRMVMVVVGLALIAGIVAISGYRRETGLVIFIVGVAKTFETISTTFYGLLQQRERMDRMAKAMILRGILSLIALGAGVYLTGDLIWGVVGLATVWLLILVCYDVPSGALILRLASAAPQGNAATEAGVAETLRPRWDVRTLARLAWLALPMGMVIMLMSLTTNIPRYFLERQWGELELGIFAAMAYLMVAGMTVVSALGRAASPRLAVYYAARQSAEFCRLLFKLTGIGVLLGVAGVLIAVVAGREILVLFYQPEYGERADVLVLISVASGLEYATSFVGYGITAARYFRSQAVLFAVLAAATVLISFALIPTRGLQGAGEALIIAGVFRLLGSLAILAHALHELGRARDRIGDIPLT